MFWSFQLQIVAYLHTGFIQNLQHLFRGNKYVIIQRVILPVISWNYPWW